MAKVDKVESKYDGDRSVCLFPIYVDARKTVAEGRKVPMSHAAECPTHQEVGMALQHLKLPTIFENTKKYSRDYMMMGRFRVKVVREDGKPYNAQVPNRRALMLAVGAFVAAIPGRKPPPKPPAPTPLAERSAASKTPGGKGGSSSSAATAAKKSKK